MKPETTIDRKCLSCDKTLDAKKRKDSKFCNEYCRAAYHNPKRAGIDPRVVKINKILYKNLEIMESLLGKRQYLSVDTEKLNKKGFNFNFFTQENSEYRYVYYMCYTAKGGGSYIISKGFESVLKLD
ncbi:MAG: hypothetical protein V4557_12545 [Bacteroidota bacterium]